MDQLVAIVGAGLAGSELAFQLAEKGISVAIYEQRLLNDKNNQNAHQTTTFAELVCSNSLRSNCMHNAAGLLKEELRITGSMLISVADSVCVPAGSSLAVSREEFSKKVTKILSSHPNIDFIAERIFDVQTLLNKHQYVVVASGPMTHPVLADNLKNIIGDDYLYFYDAIAPIINVDSIDFDICFKANRYDFSDSSDYINAPLNKEEYYEFVENLKNGEKVSIEHGDQDLFFKGCLPIEVMAMDANDTLLHGPLRGDGLRDPRTGNTPFAAVQLRQDNTIGSMYNMVGFQTRLKYSEQERIFRSLPGLKNLEFFRLGSMHRNTFVNAPKVLSTDMSLNNNDRIFLAGQISGVEGYIETISHAMIVFEKILCRLNLSEKKLYHANSAIASLERYLQLADTKNFQPMKINFGLLPSLNDEDKKKYLKGKNRFEHRLAYSRRSIGNFGIKILF